MRWTCFILGLCALGAAWLGPLPSLAKQAFFAHMTMHMMVVAVAAPLIALGVSGSRHDPVARWPSLFAPVPLSIIELMIASSDA